VTVDKACSSEPGAGEFEGLDVGLDYGVLMLFVHIAHSSVLLKTLTID
jgi:hypothetical protein